MNDAFILTLAYPETIVMVADEWYSPFLKYIGIGKKDYVRAGHAALVVIEKATGNLDYYDFGRYVTPKPTGRVRSKVTDHELDMPLKAKIATNKIVNLDELLIFLATHPKLTHGEGTMLASVCDEIDFYKAKQSIETFQKEGLITYAAFGNTGSNCARFVTDVLIASVTNKNVRKKLLQSKRFTPSTIGNVLIADTQNAVYKVSDTGFISNFNSTLYKEHRKLFLDRLKYFRPNLEGKLEPITNTVHHEKAQWLSGIGGGAWFELHCLGHPSEYRFRRISPYGNIDVDGIYTISEAGFDIEQHYEFVPYSNCHFFHIKQHETVFRFDFLKLYELTNSAQKVH